jgi:DNA-binding MarR family transcriptional regulator
VIRLNCKESDASIGRFISILYRHAQAYISKELAAYNIGSGQYDIIVILSRKNGAIQDELASVLQLDKANVARSVTKLEAEGYVRREIDADDRRVYHICLTDKGREVVPIVKKVLLDWNKLVLSKFEMSEKEMLNNLLQKMANNTELKKQPEMMPAKRFL